MPVSAQQRLLQQKLIGGASVRAGSSKTIRVKTLLIITITLLGLVVILYLPLRVILLGSYLSLEQQDARYNMERAVNALTDDIAALDQNANDYATWDDTYRFIQDRNPEYIAINYVEQTFLTNRLNLVLIVDPNGQVIFGRAFDLLNSTDTPLPERLRSLSTSDLLLRQPIAGNKISGLLQLAAGPMLISARPIVHSDNTGPIRGVLIMGRYLNAEETRRISTSTQLSLGFYRFDDPQPPDDVRLSLASLTPTAAMREQPLSEQTIAAYTLLNDIYGAPSLIARVEMPRNIYAQGKTSLLYFILALLATGLVFGTVMLVLIERAVLSRLTGLGVDVRQISISGDLGARVAVAGGDEVAQLADTINRMLSAFERMQADRKHAEEVRAGAQEEVIRAREQFTQMVVHDLKTPLTALIGFLDILKVLNLAADQREEIIDSARRSATRMDNLVATILDTARLTEGRLIIRREITDIAALLQSCAADLRVWAEQDSHDLTTDLPDHMPMLLLDSGLLQRVIINLLSNAIKHTPARTTIVLGARVRASELHLWVHDNGPGIPLARQRSLFERFSVTEQPAGRQANTGLGLTFCKLAIEAQGGSLVLDSAPAGGTSFAITLPLEVANQGWETDDQLALAHVE
jgi:sensor domain CHASE-containing protein/nitrogen-specific signal transduction histidine kinase